VKFCMEIGHKHTYKFCLKRCMYMNSYRCGNGETFEDISGKLNIAEICTNGNNNTQKWITKFHNH
jgi:hypothetical protein